MRFPRVVGLLLVIWIPLWVLPAPGLAQAPAPVCERCTDVAGNGDSLVATSTQAVSDRVPNRGDPATHGEAPGRQSWLVAEEVLVPACTTNSRTSVDALCTAAVASCPAPDQVRYWVWHQQSRVTVDEAGGRTQVVERPWYQEPGTFCLGPDDPRVPAIGRVLAAVQVEFQRLPLPVGVVRTDPAPVTLVNVPTAFSAGSGEPAVFTPTVLGVAVSITARPVSWQWQFGDGQGLTTDVPGRPQQPVVSHVFTRPGDFSAQVRVTWTGTFSLPGSAEVFPIREPAFVQGPATPVQVREARSQLVAPR